MSVPSNLIPTRVTELPEYEGTSVFGWSTYSIDGHLYKAQLLGLVSLAFVPSSRSVNTGKGLLGGGDLSQDRTLYVDFSANPPQPLGVASEGFSDQVSRGDHVHPALDLANLPETQGVLPLGRGGTGAALSPSPGAVTYSGPAAMAFGPIGQSGDFLLSGGAGAPSWRPQTTLAPAALGVAAAGADLAPAHADHVHPAADLATGAVTGILPVPKGGTGAGSLTGYVKGAGVTPLTASPTIPAGDIAGTLGADHGGTGLNLYTPGDLIVATGNTTLDKLADVATGNALISGGVGVAPSWGKITLTGHVSGVLPPANGGVGAALAHAAGAVTFSNGAALALTTVGAAGQFLTSNGAGAPSWTGFSGVNPQPLGVANPGTSASPARADHVHQSVTIGGGISGTMADFDNSLTDGDFVYQLQAATLTTLQTSGVASIGGAPNSDRVLTVRKDVVNGGAKVSFMNDNAAGAGFVQVSLTNAAGGGGLTSYAFGPNFVSAGLSQASGNLIQADGAGGLTLFTSNAAGSINFATVSAVRMKVAVGGEAEFYGPWVALKPNGPAQLAFEGTGFAGATNYMLRQSITGVSNEGFSIRNTTAARNDFWITAAGDVGVPGTLKTGSTISTGLGLTAGQYASLELGQQRTGDGGSYIDFVTVQGADYQTRMVRDAGANGNLAISNGGAGNVSLVAEGAGSLTLATSNAPRLFINAAGNVGINTSAPVGKLSVSMLNASAPGANWDSTWAVFGKDGATARCIGLGVLDNRALYVSLAPSVIWLNAEHWAQDFKFYTAGTQRLTIDPSGASVVGDFSTSGSLVVAGNLGVGTGGVPAVKFHVKSSAELARFETTSAAGTNYLTFYNPSGRMGYFGYGGPDPTMYINSETGALQLITPSTMQFVAGGAERMRILANGEITTNGGTIKAGDVWAVRAGGTTGVLYLNSAGDKYLFNDGGQFVFAGQRVSIVGGGLSCNGDIVFGAGGASIVRSANNGSTNIGGGTTLGDGAALVLRGDGQSVEGTMAGGHEFFTHGVSRMVLNGAGQFIYGRRDAFDGVSSLPVQVQWGVAINAPNTGPQTVMTFMNSQGAGVRVGWIGTDGSTTSYVTTSDERAKANIVDAADAGTVIDAIRVREFDFIVGDNPHVRFGTIAQELHTVAPEAVAQPGEGDDPDSYWGVDYSKLVPMLIKEIQGLRARVALLEAA